MTLRQKLLLPLFCISLLMGGYIHFVWTPRSLQQAELNYVASVTNQLSSVTEGMIPPLLGNQLDIIYENLAALKSKNPGWKDVRLLSPSGKQIYPLAAAGSVAPTGENLRKIEMPIKYLDASLGKLIVVLDITPALDKLTRQNDELALLLFSMLAVMFLTIVLELELAVRKPLRALNNAARRLAAADYAASLPNAGRDEVGELVGSFAYMRDELHRQRSALVEEHGKLLEQMAERRRAEDEVNALNRQLEQRVAQRTTQLEASNQELETFSYSVSHDLRTPLRAIDGFTHILQDDYASRLDDEGKRLLNVVRENTRRMSQLIDDMLNFSRTGRVEITFSEIDMAQMAHAVADELQPSFAGSKLQLEIEPIPPATGDRAMMHQVFVNLLANAIKFSRTREAPRIKVGATDTGSETIYFVRDNGVGFDMQFVNKLFSVFQRLHGVDKFEGTGIGLAIVKRIINRHGGRVWAEGKVDAGATIYFALPKAGCAHVSQCQSA
jgi:signal transduction histidine kinase